MKLSVIVYVVIALLTFGYAATNTASCNGIFTEGSDCRAFMGITGGALWPLYWTWEAFEVGRAALKERADG